MMEEPSEEDDALHQVYNFRHLESIMDIDYDGAPTEEKEGSDADGDHVVIGSWGSLSSIEKVPRAVSPDLHQEIDTGSIRDKSWATLSEIDSQYSFRSSVARILREEEDAKSMEGDDKSWATISEVDSQLTFRSSVSRRSRASESLPTGRAIVMPALILDDGEDTNRDHVTPRISNLAIEESQQPEEEQWDRDVATIDDANPIGAAASTIPRAIQVLERQSSQRADRAVNTSRSLANYFGEQGQQMRRQQQQGGDSTCERVSSSLEESATGNGNNDSTTAMPEWRQRCLLAEEQVSQARDEVAVVEAQLVSLQHRHAIEVREMHRQVAEKMASVEELRSLSEEQKEHLGALQSELTSARDEVHAMSETLLDFESKQSLQLQQHQDEAVASLASYKAKVAKLEEEKEIAESKLADALISLNHLLAEKERFIAEQHAMKISLESSQKRVRIVEERNEFLEYQVDDFKSKWECSQKETSDVKSNVDRLEATLGGVRKEYSSLLQRHQDDLRHQDSIGTLRSIELDESKQKHQKAESALKDIHDQHDRLQETMQTITKERTILQSRLDETAQKLKKTEVTLKRKHDASQKLQDEVSALRISMQNTMAERDRLLKEAAVSVAKQSKILDDKEAALGSVSHKLDASNTEIAKLQSDCKKLRNSVKDMEAQRKNVEKEASETKALLEMSLEETKHLEQEKQDLCDKLLLLQRSMQEKEENLCNQKKEHQRALTGNLLALGEQQALAKLAEDKQLSLLAECDSKQRQIESLSSIRSGLETKLSGVEFDYASLQLKFDEAHASHSRDLKKHSHAIQEYQEKLLSLGNERDELRRQVQALSTERLEHQKYAERLTKDLQESENQADDVAQAQQELELFQQTVQEKLHGLEKANMDLQQSFQQAQRDLADAILQNETGYVSLRDVILSLEQDNNGLNEKVERLQEESLGLKEELAIVDDRLRTTSIELAERIQQSRNMEEEVKKVQLGLTEMQDERKSLIAERESVISMHSQALESHRASAEDLQSRLQDTEDKKAEVLGRYEILEKRCASLAEEHTTLKSKLETTAELLVISQSEISEYQKERIQLEHLVLNLQQQVETLKSEKQALVSSHAAELAANALELEQQSEFRRIAEERASAAINEISQLKELNNELNARIMDLEDGLLDYTQRLSTATTSAESAEKRIAILEGEKSSLLLHNVEMKRKLEVIAEEEELAEQLLNSTTLEHTKTLHRGFKEEDNSSMIMKLAASVVKLEKESKGTIEKTQETFEAHNSEMKILHGQVATATAKATAFEAECTQLRDIGSNAIAANQMLESELSTLKVVNQSQDKKIKKLGKLVQKLILDKSAKKDVQAGSIPREIDVAEYSNDARNDSIEMDSSLLRETRVSGMIVEVGLRYHDNTSKELRDKNLLAKYTGPVVDSVPHGPGILKFKGGDMYVGMFEHGKMSGSGDKAGSYVRQRRRRGKTPTMRSGGLTGTWFASLVLLSATLFSLPHTTYGFTNCPLICSQLRNTIKDLGVLKFPGLQLPFSPSLSSALYSSVDRKDQSGKGNVKVREIMSVLMDRYGDIRNPPDRSSRLTEQTGWQKMRSYLYNTADRLTIEQIENVSGFLDERLSRTISVRVLQECPRILRKPVGSFLSPTADFLREIWGQDLFLQAIQRNPALLLTTGVGYVPFSERTKNTATQTLDSSEDIEFVLLNRTSMSINAVAKLKRDAPFVFGLSPSRVTTVLDFMEQLLRDGEGNSKSSTPIPSVLGKIFKSHPRFLALSVESYFRPRVEFLSSSCELNATQVAKVIQKANGSFLGLSVEQNLKPTVDFLLSNVFCDVDKRGDPPNIQLQRCLECHPQILGLSLSNLRKKTAFLNSLCPSLASRVAKRCPSVYSLSLEGNIRPTVEFLLKVWGRDSLSSRDAPLFESMLFEYPNVLSLSVDGNLQPTMAFFNNTGYTRLDSDWNLVKDAMVNKPHSAGESDNRIRGRYIATSLYGRLLPRWHYCFSDRNPRRNGLQEESKSDDAVSSLKPKRPPLHLLVMATDKAFCDGMNFDIEEYLDFKADAIPRLKFSSQFDTWLKTGRPIDL